MTTCQLLSLSGLNSDRLATATARRSLQGRGLGTVIINLQQTKLDGETTLRLFAPADQVRLGLNFRDENFSFSKRKAVL